MKLRIIHIARKPPETTVSSNVLEHGTGGLNIDESRVPCDDHPGVHKREGDVYSPTFKGKEKTADSGIYHTPTGRWPANLILQHKPKCGAPDCVKNCPVADLEQQSLEGGIHSAGKTRKKTVKSSYEASSYHAPVERQMDRFGDSGGASRFFKQVKG